MNKHNLLKLQYSAFFDTKNGSLFYYYVIV